MKGKVFLLICTCTPVNIRYACERGFGSAKLQQQKIFLVKFEPKKLVRISPESL